jgi:uncharacterized protein (DUF433 family)
MRGQQLLERITLNPDVMAGKPVVKSTRLTVEFILGLLAQGATPTEVLGEYEGLNQEDLQACFLFAARSLRETEVVLLTPEIQSPVLIASPRLAHPEQAVEFVKEVTEEPNEASLQSDHSLRGLPVNYENPFEPVAEKDWNTLS